MTTLLLSLFVNVVRADVLFLDLNNAPGEVAACVKADRDHVWVLNRANAGGHVVDASLVEQAIAARERAGDKIDSIVISGHNGNGQFFGGDQGENTFSAAALSAIVNKIDPATGQYKYPRTRQSLTNMALWGCYTGSVAASENYWMKVSPNVKFTMGFPVQSPSKERPKSHELLGEFCKPEMRAAAARAQTKDQLCQFYRNLPLIRALGASVSNCSNVASAMYGKDACYSNEELKARCAQFDPGDQGRALFNAYFNALDGYEDPPPDGDDIDAGVGSTPLRDYYNQLHLWRHCMNQLNAAPRGYDMPLPTKVIRLVKYEQLRDNINRLNRKELAEYDARLSALGLSGYRLGNLNDPDMNRAEIQSRLSQAMQRMDTMARQGVMAGKTDPGVVWRMASGIRTTLIDLDYKDKSGAVCSDFSLVHAGIRNPAMKSRCIVSYEQARNKP